MSGAGHSPPHAHPHGHEPASEDDAAERAALTRAFLDGFRAAADKRGFLALARIPLELDGPDGGFKLMGVRLEEDYVVGAAAPAFGARALTYQPLPGARIRGEGRVRLLYVSLGERREIDLADLWTGRDLRQPLPDPGQELSR